MEKLLTKHFQYSGTDDYDQSLDEQINTFIVKEKIASGKHHRHKILRTFKRRHKYLFSSSYL